MDTDKFVVIIFILFALFTLAVWGGIAFLVYSVLNHFGVI